MLFQFLKGPSPSLPTHPPIFSFFPARSLPPPPLFSFFLANALVFGMASPTRMGACESLCAVRLLSPTNFPSDEAVFFPLFFPIPEGESKFGLLLCVYFLSSYCGLISFFFSAEKRNHIPPLFYLSPPFLFLLCVRSLVHHLILAHFFGSLALLFFLCRR